MSCHKCRLDRLMPGMGALAEDFRSAWLDRLTDEELLAEVVVEAVKLGFNPEVARTPLRAAGIGRARREGRDRKGMG